VIDARNLRVFIAKDSIMNASKIVLLLASVASLAAPGIVFGACSHSTDITNTGSGTLRFVELKSSYAVFKTQWTGLLVIPAGQTRTINWTSDLDCEDASGVPNRWDVKLIRSIGTTHYCGNMDQSRPVEVSAPDLCFPQ
jgi:hypothetical protein